MRQVYIASDNIINSLGANTEKVWQAMLANKGGVRLVDDIGLYPEPFWASLTDSQKIDVLFQQIGNPDDYTRFEKMAILSAYYAIENCDIAPESQRTLFVISTTKGNIDLLEMNKKQKYEPERLYMWHTAKIISSFFKNVNEPLVVSNACISGVLAIINASAYLRSGKYDNAVVIGADIASEFVVAGFQSFKSLATGHCKPFDADRDGLNLGEGAGAIVLTTNETLIDKNNSIIVLNGASANDSNHISGPSRTGDGLFYAVDHAMKVSGKSAKEISYVSAHGTATPYNDEMESKAFARALLSDVPLNSMKAYFGHTLGAAGVIETIIATWSMKKNILLRTLGYTNYGVPEKITVLDRNMEIPVSVCLKTASGFGGCNAALILEKV